MALIIIKLPSLLVKGESDMDKEKILEKTRSEKMDEGFESAKNKRLGLGYKIFLVLITVLLVFNLFRG